MSISTLQEKFFNKGCGASILAVAAIAMAVSMFNMRGASSRDEANGEGSGSAVVTVGNVPVPAALFQAQAGELAAQAMREQAMQMKVSPETLGRPDASVQAMAAVRAVGLTLQKAAIQALVGKSPITENEIRAVVTSAVAQDTGALKQSLVAAGKIKANATTADVEKALADGLIERFRDPAQKAALVEQVAPAVLVQRLGTAKVGSDDDLRNSYKGYVVRRIFLSSTSGSTEKPEARAAKAEADLKAGKSFDAVMDALSNDPAPSGKKPHDVTETIPAEAFGARPEFASLKGKGPNATTGAVDVPGGKAIYQLVSVKDNLPPDFEKNKATLRAARVRDLGQKELESQIKTYVSSDAVKWKSPGYQALALVSDATSRGIAMDPAATKKATDAALAALKSENAADHRLAAQALIVITDKNNTLLMKPAEAAANRKVALDAAQTNGVADPTLLLELAGLYGDAKDGAKATDTLVAASKANDDYEVTGQRIFGDIASKALDLQKKGVLTKDQLARVQAQQAVYSAARTENAKLAAEAKANEAKEKAANEAELARQRAEAAQATGGAKPGVDDATKKANEAELARQKAEAGKKPAGSGGSMLQTTAGGE